MSLHLHPFFSRQVIRVVSNLPLESTGQSAAAAVRGLGPRYAGVTAVDSGSVDVLTRLERPAEAGIGDAAGQEGTARWEEETAYEQLLLGKEVHTVRLPVLVGLYAILHAMMRDGILSGHVARAGKGVHVTVKGYSFGMS